MRVLVTGSGGFLGGHVVMTLKEEGHVPLVFARKGDYDAVVHLAWHAKPGDDPSGVHDRCVESTVEIVDYCVRHGTPMVFTSTASVYGVGRDEPLIEDATMFPNCDYTRGKARAEGIVLGRLRSLGCVLRMGSLMGLGVTRTRTDLVVNAFASDAYQGKTVEVWNPGAWKPVLHVRDAAGLVVRAVAEGWSGTYNAASACMTAGDIARLVQLQTGCEVKHVEGSPNGERSCRVDCSKLEMKLPSVLWRGVPEAVKEFEGYVSRS